MKTKNKDDKLHADYSLTVLLSELEKFIFLVVLFTVLHKLPEFFITFLTIIPIRMFMGGIHRKTILGCFLQSAGILGLGIFLSEQIFLPAILQWALHGVLLVFIWITTPIQSEQRMKYNQEQRMRFKAKALTVLLILLQIEIIIPKKYGNLMETALLVYVLETATSCILLKGKEVKSHERKVKRKVEYPVK